MAVFAVVVLEISFSKEQIDSVCHASCLKFHLEPSWNHLEISGAHGQPVWSTLQEDNFRELEEAFEKGLEGCHAGEPTGTVMALFGAVRESKNSFHLEPVPTDNPT